MSRVLVARTDSDGDVLLAGPAIRAVARKASVTLLVSPAGEQAARLLPGVERVMVRPCPWSGYVPPPVDRDATLALVDELARGRFDAALILTSYHQSPLPGAMLLRLAGVPWIGATCEDYSGSLLDLRHRLDPGDDRHEVERAIALVTAAGYQPDPDDDLRLAVRRPLPPVPGLPACGYVVVHPGASVPARAPHRDHAAWIVAALADAGRTVLVTGGPRERELTARVAAAGGVDLGGRTDLGGLATVLAGAGCVVVGNTGPAHLAAAVGAPVVSLFAPVVSPAQWRPWGVPHVVLGDERAPCRDTRARDCPLPGHPCLTSIDPQHVLAAVEDLTAARGAGPPVEAPR